MLVSMGLTSRKISVHIKYILLKCYDFFFFFFIFLKQKTCQQKACKIIMQNETMLEYIEIETLISKLLIQH
jgi:hypothetical protein